MHRPSDSRYVAPQRHIASLAYWDFVLQTLEHDGLFPSPEDED